MTTPKLPKAENLFARDKLNAPDPAGAALVKAILSAAPDKVRKRYKKIFKGELATISPAAIVHIALAQLLILSLDGSVDVRDQVKLSTALIESVRKIIEKFQLESSEPVAIMLADFTSTTTADLEQGIEFGK